MSTRINEQDDTSNFIYDIFADAHEKIVSSFDDPELVSTTEGKGGTFIDEIFFPDLSFMKNANKELGCNYHETPVSLKVNYTHDSILSFTLLYIAVVDEESFSPDPLINFSEETISQTYIVNNTCDHVDEKSEEFTYLINYCMERFLKKVTDFINS